VKSHRERKGGRQKCPVNDKPVKVFSESEEKTKKNHPQSPGGKRDLRGIRKGCDRKTLSETWYQKANKVGLPITTPSTKWEAVMRAWNGGSSS